MMHEQRRLVFRKSEGFKDGETRFVKTNFESKEPSSTVKDSRIHTGIYAERLKDG
jgi:hypothetical protein